VIDEKQVARHQTMLDLWRDLPLVDLLNDMSLLLQLIQFRAYRLSMGNDDPRLYDAARDACHECGMEWTDPRTGTVYPPPKKR